MKTILLSVMLAWISWQSASFSQQPEKSALILIETQNEWMHPDGILRKLLIEDEDMMQNSIKNIEKAVAHARQAGIAVVHVGLRFEDGYPELANGKSGLRKAIPHAGTFRKGGFGAQFYETVQPAEGEFVVSGRAGASGFTGSNLDVFLRNNNIQTLYLAGYATHVCVESTLRDAHEKGYRAVLLSDAASAFNRAQQTHVLTEVVHHFGEHIRTEEFVGE